MPRGLSVLRTQRSPFGRDNTLEGGVQGGCRGGSPSKEGSKGNVVPLIYICHWLSLFFLMLFFNSNFNTNPFPPNINSNNNSYFFLINGKQVGPIQGDAIKNLIENNTINTETITWKIGMANWEKISKIINFLG